MAAKKDSAPKPVKDAAPKRKNLPSGSAYPEMIHIVGLDEGYRDGEAGFDEELLDEPERLVAPDEAAVNHCLENGPGKAVEVVEKVPGSYIVVDGRQTVMATRGANALLLKEDSKADLYKVNFLILPLDAASALHVCRANQYAKRDPVIVNARRAARMLAMKDGEKKRYSKADVIGAFSDDMARPISKQTLDNWLSAARCAPDIQARAQPYGDVPVNILYTVGKAGEKHDDDFTRFAKQRLLLDEILAKGAKGDQGAKNASAALRKQNNGGADDSPESEGGSADTEGSPAGTGAMPDNTGKPENGGGGKRAASDPQKALAFPPDVIYALEASLSPDLDIEDDGAEPEYDDSSTKGRREYREGDFQRISHAILMIMTGNEEGWWILKGGAGATETDNETKVKGYPSVYRYFRKYDPTGDGANP